PPSVTNDYFFVNLVNPVNASIARSQAVGTIIDHDAPPCVTVADTTIVEGDSGTTMASFIVSLSRSNQQPVSVRFRTDNGSALAGEDFVAVDSFVTFAPGVMTQTISIPIIGDLRNEPDETFTLSLTAATNAWICRSQALGQILD